MGGRGGGGSKTPGSRGRPRVVHSMHASRFNTYVAAAVKEPAIFIQRASTHQRERLPSRKVSSVASRRTPRARDRRDGREAAREEATRARVAVAVPGAVVRRRHGRRGGRGPTPGAHRREGAEAPEERGDLIEGGERAERRRRGRGGRERESEREADADDDDEERVDESGGARGHPRAGASRGVPRRPVVESGHDVCQSSRVP